MAYNIILNNPQQFSTSPTGTPLVNAWTFSPPPLLELNHILGDAIPGPINIDTFIKNYWLEFDEAEFDSIFIVADHYLFNSNVVWAQYSSEILDETVGLDEGYDIAIEDLNVTNVITLQNLNLLTEGLYKGWFRFRIRGVLPGGFKTITIAPEVKYSYTLNVSASPLIILNPLHLIYSYLRAGALPDTQELDITAEGAWILKTDIKISVAGPGIVDSSTATQTVVTGNGNTTLDIGIKNTIENITGNLFETQILVTNDQGQNAAAFVTVNIFDNDSFIFNPESLSFNAVLGFSEATPLSFIASGFGEFTLTAPSWLTLSNDTGENSGSFLATPLEAIAVGEGTYNGNIILNAGGNDYYLPVTYVVQGTISTLLDDGNFNFTKNIEYLNIWNPNRIFENFVYVTLIIRVYNYITNAEEEKIYPYAIPFYDNFAKQHIGAIVERLMKKAISLEAFKFSTLSGTDIILSPIYKPASVEANIKIINRDSQETIYEHNLYDMQFVAGKKPLNFVNNKCILSNSENVKRVTPSSIELLNFLIKSGTYDVKLKRNLEEAVTIASQTVGQNNIFRFAFDFSAYQIGDVITAQVISSTETLSKKYQIIPEGIYSQHIGFINQYNTLELLEFTGSLTLSSDIQKINHLYYKDLVEKIENVESKKQVEIVVNTGSIFKENQVIIDEIIRSKKAWLIFQENPAIELVPKSTKIVNTDSETELYEYDIVFEVNRSNDAENYIL